MVICETYFCPECAHKFSSTESAKSLELKVNCPKCSAKAQFSGYPFILGGGILWFFFAMILVREAIYFGYAIFFICFVLGIIRLFRTHKAYINNKNKGKE